MSETDQSAVREARDGSPQAWATLLASHRLPLYAYVFQWVRHEQTALDIVQESFINAARHIRSLREDARFASWLFNIAHQKCQNHGRRKRPETSLLEPEDDRFIDSAPDPGEWLIRREQEAGFMRLLEQLPPPQRSAVMLHFLEDFSLEEIASITGANVGTVKSRLHCAKKLLRKLLEDATP